MTEQKKALVALSPIGIFSFSENQDLVYFKLFEKDPKQAFEQFEKGISSEFLDHLKDYKVASNDLSNRLMRDHVRQLALDLTFVKNQEEFNKFISEFSLLFSKKRMRFSFTKDKFVIQANNALEDLLRITNLMSERLKEWFGMHYPECKLSMKELTTHVATFGSRENFPEFVESVGLEISKEDEEVIKSYAESIERVNEEKHRLEKYIRDSMKELAPNTSSLIDELLLAKLLAAAGSLEKLARMSASSIQLIGAEKALFRHLRKQGKSPKFGLIFMSSWIKNVSDEEKGKVARTLSAKLMQSIRIDFYSGRDESARLKKELEQDLRKRSG